MPGASETALSAGPRVVVTGGAGFIGDALVRSLAARGVSVVSFDVRAAKGARAGVEDVVGDVRDAASVESVVRGAGLVFHLAAVVGVHEYLRRPDEVLDINVLGTRNVLKACAAAGVPVVFASTSEVFGRNDLPLSENSDSLLGPSSNARWSYAVSKLAGEHYARALASHGLRYAIVRYFNVYGPGLDSPGAGRVVSQFLGKLRANEPLVLVDGGGAERAFCFIDDAVAATIAVSDALVSGRIDSGRAVNVGRAESVSMQALASRMLALSGSNAGTVDVAGSVFFGDGFEEIPSRVPDVSVLRDEVGFEATVPLDEGLRRTLQDAGFPVTPIPSTKVEVVPVVRPVLEPDGVLLSRISRALVTGRLSNDGPLVTRFEKAFAAKSGVERSVAVGSGAVALQLALRVLGLKGKVILPSFTYIATLAAVTENGLEPVFADVDPDTFTLDPGSVADVLARLEGEGGDVAAILAVNAYGVHPDLRALRRLADSVGAALVYDDAHGVGSVDAAGRTIPSEPDATAFSLHATKILPAVEGGVVVARDPKLLDEVRRLKNHGLVPNDVLKSRPALNARMDELRAAVALHSLARLDGVIERRHTYAAKLRKALSQAGARPQHIPDGQRTNWQNLAAAFPVGHTNTIEAKVARAASKGLELRRYFFPALHHLGAFSGAELPVTDALIRSLACVPMHSRMSDDELARIVAALAD